MTFEQATAWLNALIDYEKAPDFSYPEAFKLDRVQALMDSLGNPERSWRSIHVAGTKGKGTVATYLDALLRGHEVRTGLYTSPHLVDYRERIRIDGTNVPKTRFADTMSRLVPYADIWQQAHPDERLSFFDVLTAAGFDAFRGEAVEWAVVEVGMGGRLDATNVIESDVALITPIALEHMKYLGGTLEAIAGEKAGVIKRGVPTLIQSQGPVALRVLLDRCDEVGATAHLLDDVVRAEARGDLLTLRVLESDGVRGGEYHDIALAALGAHQATNFTAALAGIHLTGIALDEDVVRDVARKTAIPGRLQAVAGQPPILIDVSHTPDSARMLAETVRDRFAGRRTTLVFGCALDKRADAIAAELAPLAERVIVVQLPGIRAMAADDMLGAWHGVHPFVTQAPSVHDAIENARDTTPHHGLIIVCGSFMLAGAAMEVLGVSPDGGDPQRASNSAD